MSRNKVLLARRRARSRRRAWQLEQQRRYYIAPAVNVLRRLMHSLRFVEVTREYNESR